MLVRRPMKHTFLGQKFGQNNACAKVNENGEPVFPWNIRSKVGKKCPRGYVDFYLNVLDMLGHNGDDLPSYYKQPIYFNVIAECDFYVHKASTDPGIGIGLEIVSKEPVYLESLPKNTTEEVRNQWEQNGHKLHVKFIFWHAQSNLVEDGDTVKPGQMIQLANSTGASSGNHLHLSMKFCNEIGQTWGWDNGFKGAVNYREITGGTNASVYRNQFILSALGKEETLKPAQTLRSIAFYAQSRTRDILLRVADVVEEFVGGLVGRITS